MANKPSESRPTVTKDSGQVIMAGFTPEDRTPFLFDIPRMFTLLCWLLWLAFIGLGVVLMLRPELLTIFSAIFDGSLFIAAVLFSVMLYRA